MTEKFNLQWNEFTDNLSSVFKDLRSQDDFSDITLISEEGDFHSAHKVLLSASSTFFKSILTKMKAGNNYLYLKGVSRSDMSLILDFIYKGEANVYQEHLDSFMGTANLLQLKGMSDDKTGLSSHPQHRWWEHNTG